MNLSTTYLGMQLPHPLMVGSSSLTDDLDTVRKLEDEGAAGSELRRLAPEDYADGVGLPSGPSRSSARVISNLCASQDGSVVNLAGASSFLWQWGQFLDHDLSLTQQADPPEALDIGVPAGDPFFDPEGSGRAKTAFRRSAYHVVDGRRQQVNAITAFIDGSQIYGSDEARARALRSSDGTGRLKTSAGGLLPFNVDGLPNAPSTDASFFLAGDSRANEQTALTALHTVFVREHNRWADLIRSSFPLLTGDEIYSRARAMVGAELQAITYREFLPVLLGPNALPPYQGYDPEVNPGIANEFSTAAFRVGHSMLPPELLRLDAEGRVVDAGHLSLASAFFSPRHVLEEGIDSVLRGLLAQPAQEVDPQVVDEVRNFLFGPPGSGGFDLASLNVQRGRDHGLPGYNQTRRALGLSPVESFAEIHPDPQVQEDLELAFDDVEEIDLWVGGLSEPHVSGALVGETFWLILVDQFRRLRDGDRFWYESYLPAERVAAIERSTLGVIIRRNTGVGTELPDAVFHVPP
jgi:hypothetical protein